MFENLGDRLQGIIHKIKGYGKITEENISDISREIRLALLEADVNYQVVKEFTKTVKEKALGEEVRTSLNPSEVFVKILKDELIFLLGSVKEELNTSSNPTVLMLVGLQGSGKTTTIGKLGSLVRKKYKKKPLIVAADVYRPAAIDQLKQIGKELDIEVYEEGKISPKDIVANALVYAKENKFDYVLIDTAGRLHVDEELMKELIDIESIAKPHEILLVVDSMMGQDAINVIQGFNEKIHLTGAILTKLDGDTKGGVALSIRHLTNIPIKFIGTSEKLDGLDEFHPDRMAGRILGMGDILSMAEKVEDVIDKEAAKETVKRISKGQFDLEDFLSQLRQIKKIGSLEKLIKMIPGIPKIDLSQADPKQFAKVEAIILAMTVNERRNPEILKASRKIRIANGSGTSVQEINKLLKQFEQMKIMLKQMKNGNFKMPM